MEVVLLTRRAWRRRGKASTGADTCRLPSPLAFLLDALDVVLGNTPLTPRQRLERSSIPAQGVSQATGGSHVQECRHVWEDRPAGSVRAMRLTSGSATERSSHRPARQAQLQTRDGRRQQGGSCFRIAKVGCSDAQWTLSTAHAFRGHGAQRGQAAIYFARYLVALAFPL